MTAFLPDDNKAYKRKDYWDARFSRCDGLSCR